MRIGENCCRADFPEETGLPVHRLFISEGGLEADLTFRSEVPGWKPGEGRTEYGDLGYFFWAVPAPRARVEGSVRIGQELIEARGTGYHDHNVITADARRIISYWYWGRLYTDDITLLYAYVRTRKRFGGVASSPLMLACRDEVVLSTGEVAVRDSEFTHNRTAHRDYPRRLEVEVPGRVSLALQVREVIDAHDLLEDLPKAVSNPLTRPILRRLAGRPGWFRFASDFRLSVRHRGMALEEQGITLHEMVALQ